MLASTASRRALLRSSACLLTGSRAAAGAAVPHLQLLPTVQPQPKPQHQPRRGIFGGLGNQGGGGVPAKKEEGETAVAKPIDFDVASRIEGQETQIVVVRVGCPDERGCVCVRVVCVRPS